MIKTLNSDTFINMISYTQMVQIEPLNIQKQAILWVVYEAIDLGLGDNRKTFLEVQGSSFLFENSGVHFLISYLGLKV